MELAAGLAAAQAQNNNIVWKITSWEEFWVTLEKYSSLANDETSKIVFVDEERLKVYGWLHKQSDELKEIIEEGTPEEIQNIAISLHKFDKLLTCYPKFYKEHGSDLFWKIFSMQKPDHPSWVADFSREIVDDIKTEEYSEPEALLNRVIDNILLKIIATSDSQEMLVSMVSVMFEGKQHSIVVIKSLLVFSKIFNKVKENQAKFMQGSLYTLGALLKIEARSYLVSTGKRDIIAEDCKEEEDQHFEVKIRDLSQKEINHFEKELQQAQSNFV